MQLEILDCRKRNLLYSFEANANETIESIKRKIFKANAKLYPDRQSLRLEPRGKTLSDGVTLNSLNLKPSTAQLFLRDLGPQIAWKTVFLLEYFGPMVIYPIFYCRPTWIYGHRSHSASMPPFIMHLSCACFTFHFAKRLYETLFVHRFSHATMPLSNVFKNCGYYWLFAGFIAYFNNHILYTEPSFGQAQIAAGFCGFALCEMGNLSIHLSFMNMRAKGSKERKIPMPTKNPLTKLFSLVSCPNYTYEVCAWLSYSIMTQSLPSLLFTAAGLYQMTVWAIAKHKMYKQEFPNYPKGRKSIIPFVV